MILKQLSDEIFSEKQNEIRQIIREELKDILTSLPQQVAKPYLQTNEVCELLGCSTNWLRNFCVEYNIRPKKRCGKYYYLRSDIDRVFHECDLYAPVK